jgi:large subunit ribosomal protein L19
MDSALAAISKSSLKQNLPQFKVGQTVRIHQRIKEGEKERIQVFEGIIIKKNNGTGVNGTITVRKVVDGIGVERVFAIHSPLIAKVEITKQAKVRRSKLYFLRDRTGKAARLRTTLLEGQVFEPTSAVEAPAEEEAAESPAEEVKSENEEVKKDEATEKAPAEEAKEEVKEEAAPAEKEVKEEAPAEETKTEEAAPEATKEEEKTDEKAE